MLESQEQERDCAYLINGEVNMSHNSKVQFYCFWNWQHWHLLPAISLDNYDNQFDIHFQFMGLFVEISFMKKGW